MTTLLMQRDAAGKNTFGLKFTGTAFSVNLDQNIDTTCTVPDFTTPQLGSNKNTYLAIFGVQPGSEVYVANNTTAEVPVGNTFAATYSSCLPASRVVEVGDVLHFITPDIGARVTVEFYAV